MILSSRFFICCSSYDLAEHVSTVKSPSGVWISNPLRISLSLVNNNLKSMACYPKDAIPFNVFNLFETGQRNFFILFLRGKWF